MTLPKEPNENIFRLSALLYKDANYNMSKKNTIKKIIESIFIENNSGKSIDEVVLLCNDKYGLDFCLEELEKIIEENLDEFDIQRAPQTSLMKIRLTDKRFNSISGSMNNRVEGYIDRFIDEAGLGDKISAKEILYKFLYDTFTSSFKNYQYFLKNPADREPFKISNHKYKPEEVKVINSFLCFDDSDKDKAIFDLVSLSLEYCMLTGNGKAVYIDGIKNKVFYLDSNIIYRAIGVNGDLRKKLTLNFLKKCLDVNITIRISQYADKEFKESISYNISKISSYKSVNVAKELSIAYFKEDNIYSFYCEWGSGRENREGSYFEAFVLAKYSSFLKEFKITVDYDAYFKTDDSNYIDTEQSILEFKSKNSRDLIPKKIVEYDAKIIISIKRLREIKKDEHKKLLETKHFILTTDHMLKEWEHQDLDGTPILLLPSEWLAIMLRFIGRTSDDYKSFVSFITLKKNEQPIRSEIIFAVLNGISELTQDITTQELYADEIINKGAEGIIGLGTVTETHQKTIEYVDKRLAEKVSSLEDKLTNYEKKSEKTINNTKNEKEKIEELEKSTREKNIKLKDELICKEVKEWRFTGYGGIVLIVISLIYILGHFFFLDSEYNIVVILLYSWINSLPEHSKDLSLLFDKALCLGGIGYGSKIVYSRLYKNSADYINQLQSIKDKYI